MNQMKTIGLAHASYSSAYDDYIIHSCGMVKAGTGADTGNWNYWIAEFSGLRYNKYNKIGCCPSNRETIRDGVLQLVYSYGINTFATGERDINNGEVATTSTWRKINQIKSLSKVPLVLEKYGKNLSLPNTVPWTDWISSRHSLCSNILYLDSHVVYMKRPLYYYYFPSGWVIQTR